jgi:hypothetical protein
MSFEAFLRELIGASQLIAFRCDKCGAVGAQSHDGDPETLNSLIYGLGGRCKCGGEIWYSIMDEPEEYDMSWFEKRGDVFADFSKPTWFIKEGTPIHKIVNDAMDDDASKVNGVKFLKTYKPSNHAILFCEDCGIALTIQCPEPRYIKEIICICGKKMDMYSVLGNPMEKFVNAKTPSDINLSNLIKYGSFIVTADDGNNKLDHQERSLQYFYRDSECNIYDLTRSYVIAHNIPKL